jgi:GT2 family glycosyltransferase
MIEDSEIGFVAIGRNEGERLKIALKAIVTLYPNSPVVYVDSGSTDSSVAFATSLGINTIQLDLSTPFTAARARNAGAEQLLQKYSTLKYIQFLDGDCEVLAGWIEAGLDALVASDVAIASGRRAERFPVASIYNTLMDMEWNTPIGEIMGVPGDMLIKVDVFNALEGFNSALIAGEDFDICLRAKQLGYKTMRVDAPMSIHDANILHISQWFKRIKRGGHAYANLYHLHATHSGHHFRRKLLSIGLWGGLFPLALVSSAIFSPLIFGVLSLLFLLMILRIMIRRIVDGDSLRVATLYAALVYIGKLPELLGIYEYWKVVFTQQRHTLIEYK